MHRYAIVPQLDIGYEGSSKLHRIGGKINYTLLLLLVHHSIWRRRDQCLCSRSCPLLLLLPLLLIALLGHTKLGMNTGQQKQGFGSPISDLLIAILELSSRFHFTVGAGLPVALHLSIMFSPSRTIMSLELSESSMLGGTARDRGRRRVKKLDVVTWNILLV